MGQPRHLGDVDDLHRRVRRAFAEGQRRARCERGLPGRQVAAVDLHGLDAVARQQVGNDVMTRAEQGATRHHPLSGAQLAQQCREHRRHAARRGAAGLSPFDQAQPLLEHRHGRVAVARIDVAQTVLLEGGLGFGGAAIDKARGHEQRLGGFLIGTALAAAAHQEGGGAELGDKLGRQDRLRHRRSPSAGPQADRDNKKPRSARARALSTVPDLLARFLTWRASRSAQITTNTQFVRRRPVKCQGARIGGGDSG